MRINDYDDIDAAPRSQQNTYKCCHVGTPMIKVYPFERREMFWITLLFIEVLNLNAGVDDLEN